MFLSALRFFELIRESGAPDDRLIKLAAADEAKWKDYIGVLVAEKYPDQINQLSDASPKSLRESFVASYEGIGPTLVEPAIRFLVAAAKDAGIEVSSHIGTRKARIAGNIRRKPKKVARQVSIHDDDLDLDEVPSSSFRDTLLSKFPNFDPTWSSEQQQSWFSAYQRLLEMHHEKLPVKE